LRTAPRRDYSRAATCGQLRRRGGCKHCPSDPLNGYAAPESASATAKDTLPRKPAATCLWRLRRMAPGGLCFRTTGKDNPELTTAGFVGELTPECQAEDLPTPLCSMVDPAIAPSGGARRCLINSVRLGRRQSAVGQLRATDRLHVISWRQKAVFRGGLASLERNVFKNTTNARGI